MNKGRKAKNTSSRDEVVIIRVTKEQKEFLNLACTHNKTSQSDELMTCLFWYNIKYKYWTVIHNIYEKFRTYFEN